MSGGGEAVAGCHYVDWRSSSERFLEGGGGSLQLFANRLTSMEVSRLFVSVNITNRGGQRGEKVLSEEELGAMEEENILPLRGDIFSRYWGGD